MKKVALISSFCDTEKKLDILDKNISTIKNLGIDVILISPFPLPDIIVDKCDYFLKTKDNPVLEWPVKAMFHWTELYLDGKLSRLSRTYSDYGWAGLNQVKQLSLLGLMLEYDQFFHMIYDLKIDDNVLSGFESSKKCSVYPSKRKEEIWEVGLHFMIFDRTHLERFVSYIYFDSYFSLEVSEAFLWLHNLKKVFPYQIEKIPVEDEIYFYEEYDFYNYSPSGDFKMFIVKDDEYKDSIKLLFYGVKNPDKGQIIINSFPRDFIMTDYYLLDLNIKDSEITNVTLVYNSETYDITKRIADVKHNTLRTV